MNKIISVAFCVVTVLVVFGKANNAVLANTADWTMSGQNLNNWRDQPNETTINSSNVNTLTPEWVFPAGGYISATPAVLDNSVYIPDSSRDLYDLNANTGTPNWSVNLSAVTGINTDSRTTPTISGNTLLVGTQKGAYELAFDKNTGSLLWKQQLDSNPNAIITQSPVIDNGIAYIGVSSSEETAAYNPSYNCCTFRGSVEALNIATGQIEWQTYTTPPGDTGNAVWGSTPVVDEDRNSLYITTGNNYTTPQNGANNSTNYVDSVLSLNLQTGAVQWADKGGSDASNLGCLTGNTNCPNPPSPDADFGQGTILIPSQKIGGTTQDVLVAGQKSGAIYGMNPSNGHILWTTHTGPGGYLGGLLWGSATDGHSVYFANANTSHQAVTLLNGRTTTGGFWGALDPATGDVLWETADPNGANALDTGAVSVANGVVYVGSSLFARRTAPNAPNFFALNAATGQIEWSYAGGGSVNSGAAIANGTVYWGTGYQNQDGIYNNQFYAFAPAAVRVPEPSSVLGVLAGLGLIGGLKRKFYLK